MKTKLIIFGLLCFKLSFGQVNFSANNVSSPIPAVPLTNPPTSAPNEIFRFQPGNVTQLDTPLAQGFNFTNARWFSMGKVVTGANTAYGLRFQLPNKAVTFGYQNANNINENPRLEWIDANNTNNLEFRFANNFTSTTSFLVATMTRDRRTVFSDNTAFVNGNTTSKVAIQHTSANGLTINSGLGNAGISTGINIIENTGLSTNTGIAINVADPTNNSFGTTIANYGLNISASGATNVFGVRSITTGLATEIDAAIYAITPNTNGNQYAGFFDGIVFSSAGFFPSDKKLKDNVVAETSALERFSRLKPVTYDYKNISELNLPQGKQHGFIAQELAEVFPELTKDIKKPVFDKEGKQTSTFEFKSVNYNGLISVMTAAINELNNELTLLKEEIASLKGDKPARKQTSPSENTKGAFINQNVPNPFGDQTTISYQLPEGTNAAEIMVTDLNGRMIKSYPVNKNQTELTIKASEIGSGIFIYSLVQNGQELLSKKMVVK